MTQKETLQKIIQELTPVYNKARDAKYDFLINAREARSKDFKGKWQSLRKIISKADQSLMDWGKDVILEKLTKKYNLYLENIATKFTQKLENLDVLDIEYKKFSTFDIELLVKTTEGTKSLSINTVQAGGYNIQCFHYRTTLRLK